jgi:hypothetical protein
MVGHTRWKAERAAERAAARQAKRYLDLEALESDPLDSIDWDEEPAPSVSDFTEDEKAEVEVAIIAGLDVKSSSSGESAPIAESDLPTESAAELVAMGFSKREAEWILESRSKRLG